MPELLEKILREKGAPAQAVQASRIIVERHKKKTIVSKPAPSPQPSLQQVVYPVKPVEQPSVAAKVESEVTKPVVVSTRPIAEFTQTTGLPLWKAFPTKTPTVPESKQLEYQKRMYATMPIVPTPISRQITPPSEITKAGAGREYKRAAYEQYLGVEGTAKSQLERKLLQSRWYVGTQPIYKVEGKERPLYFFELKQEEPALYLEQKKGLWTPTLDVVRWRREQESLIGAGSRAALHVSEVPRYMFDIDYYFAENKELYRSERLYQSYKEVKAGEWYKSWVGYQIPTYTEFIIPAVTGYGIGKVFTGVKLAGGVKHAPKLFKIGYGAGIASMGAGIGVTSYQVVSGGFSAKDIAKIGFQGLVGAVGFYGGRSAMLSSFKSKYPNLEWRYPTAKPVIGKQYVKFKEMMIKGEGKPVYESGMYQYSQMFKPSGKPKLYVGSSSPSRGSIDTFYIKELGMQKIGGVVDVTSKQFRTVFGKRAWSMKGFLGTIQKEYVPGSFDTVSVLYKAGGVNVIKQGIYSRNIISDVSAAQSVMFGGLKAIEPMSVTGFTKPSIGYAPTGFGVGLITPSFSYEMFKPEVKPVVDFSGLFGGLTKPSFRYEPVIKQRYIPVVTPVSGSISSSIFGGIPSQVKEPSFRYDIADIQKNIQASTQMMNYVYKTPSVEIPRSPYKIPVTVVPRIPFGGYGGWAWGGFDKIWGVGYRYRKHKVPTLEDLIGW